MISQFWKDEYDVWIDDTCQPNKVHSRDMRDKVVILIPDPCSAIHVVIRGDSYSSADLYNFQYSTWTYLYDHEFVRHYLTNRAHFKSLIHRKQNSIWSYSHCPQKNIFIIKLGTNRAKATLTTDRVFSFKSNTFIFCIGCSWHSRKGWNTSLLIRCILFVPLLLSCEAASRILEELTDIEMWCTTRE